MRGGTPPIPWREKPAWNIHIKWHTYLSKTKSQNIENDCFLTTLCMRIHMLSWNNVPSQLSPQWLCGNSCTWVHGHNRTSCAQVHELPQSHCGDNWESKLFSWLHVCIYIYIFFQFLLNLWWPDVHVQGQKYHYSNFENNITVFWCCGKCLQKRKLT